MASGTSTRPRPAYLPPLPEQHYSQHVLDLPGFRYAALASNTDHRAIRVIEVLSHRTHNLITCRLSHRPISVSYHALSYTWGEPLPPENAFRLFVTCEESSSQGVLLIRQTLHNFLGTAAASCEGLLLWIDALCIDQENLAEKSTQVPRMGDIYRSAQCVRIWGLYIDPVLAKVLQRYHSAGNRAFTDIRTVANDLQQSLRETDFMSATERLFGSTYFERLWIIQEIFLASKLQFYCESRWLNWSALELAHAATVTLLDLLRDSFDKLQKARHLFAHHGGFKSLDAAIEFSWDSECMDIRDKIYGLLGIVAGGEGFKVDYEESHELLWLRALHYFSSPPVRHDLELANRLVQVLDLNYQSLYDHISSNAPDMSFQLEADLTKVWVSPSVSGEQPTGMVCSQCGNAVSFDGKVFRLPRTIYTWCVHTGYDQLTRPTHVLFRSAYLVRRPLHETTFRHSKARVYATEFLRWVKSPFGNFPNWLSLTHDPSTTEPAQLDDANLPAEQTEDDPPDQEKWRYLRLIGWKMSDANAFESFFFTPHVRGSKPDVIAVLAKEDSWVYRDWAAASVSFTAAEMIRFVFYVFKVPFDEEGWISNYDDEPPASMYRALNPRTRVNLRHREDRETQLQDIDEHEPSFGRDLA